jgi:hypothetical protein
VKGEFCEASRQLLGEQSHIYPHFVAGAVVGDDAALINSGAIREGVVFSISEVLKVLHGYADKY